MAAVSNIDYLIDEVVTLPSLPGTVAQITSLVNDPNSNLNDIGKAISSDPSISLKSLRLVNSAYYGLPNKITSVEHAVSMLGMKVIKNVVFTASVFDALKVNEEALLKHNVTCGLTMRLLVESGKVDCNHFEHADEAFIYGLLHDVGKIIFAQHMPSEMQKVADICASSPFTWAQAEREVLGADHAEMGSKLAQKWQLSDELIAGIAGHHDLNLCENEEYKHTAALIGVADYLCYEAGFPSHPSSRAELNEDFLTMTGLTEEDIAHFVERLTESGDEISELMNMAA